MPTYKITIVRSQFFEKTVSAHSQEEAVSRAWNEDNDIGLQPSEWQFLGFGDFEQQEAVAVNGTDEWVRTVNKEIREMNA